MDADLSELDNDAGAYIEAETAEPEYYEPEEQQESVSNAPSVPSAERLDKINQMKQIAHEFPHKLTPEYQKMRFETLSDAEVLTAYDAMIYQVQARGAMNVGIHVFMAGVQGIEQAACRFTPFKLQGLSQSIDQDLMDDVKLLIIKHGSAIQTEPEVRIAVKLLALGTMVHQRNTELETIAAKKTTLAEVQEAKKDEVSPEKQIKLNKLDAKFQDL